MREKREWPRSASGLVVLGALSLVLWSPDGEAKSAKKAAASKGVPASVAKAPVCDTHLHPKITAVTPDPVKAGQKITIKGQNFGTKACFQKVSFGRHDSGAFRYVNDSTLVATVPNLNPGLIPVHILTAGGSSEYVLLVEKGGAAPRKAVTKSKAKAKKRSKRSTRR